MAIVPEKYTDYLARYEAIDAYRTTKPPEEQVAFRVCSLNWQTNKADVQKVMAMNVTERIEDGEGRAKARGINAIHYAYKTGEQFNATVKKGLARFIFGKTDVYGDPDANFVADFEPGDMIVPNGMREAIVVMDIKSKHHLILARPWMHSGTGFVAAANVSLNNTVDEFAEPHPDGNLELMFSPAEIPWSDWITAEANKRIGSDFTFRITADAQNETANKLLDIVSVEPDEEGRRARIVGVFDPAPSGGEVFQRELRAFAARDVTGKPQWDKSDPSAGVSFKVKSDI